MDDAERRAAHKEMVEAAALGDDEHAVERHIEQHMAEMDWREAQAAIMRLMSSNRSLLTGGDVEHVNHYLAVGEHEMALESLCLELMHKAEVPLSDMEALGALAERLGLDQESVFDSNFWRNFTAALETRRKRRST